MRKNILLILSFLALNFGLYIYLTFRTKDLYLFDWLLFLNFGDLIKLLRANPLFFPSERIINSLPFSLWVISLGFVLVHIWRKKLDSMVKIFIYVSVFSSGIGVEILQAFGYINGTFDVIDLFFLLPTILTTFFAINFFSNETQN